MLNLKNTHKVKPNPKQHVNLKTDHSNCVSLCTTVVRNMPQNSADYLPS